MIFMKRIITLEHNMLIMIKQHSKKIKNFIQILELYFASFVVGFAIICTVLFLLKDSQLQYRPYKGAIILEKKGEKNAR